MATIAKHVETDTRWLDPEAAYEEFDALTQELLGISGEEFIRRWDAGEYADVADDQSNEHIIMIAGFLPFGRKTS